MTPVASRLIAPLGLLLLTLGCAGSEKDSGPSRGSVAWLVQHERYDEAVRSAAEASAKAPQDEQLLEQYRGASVAWLINHGRKQYFAGQDAEALATFREAEAIEPNAEAVQDWIVAALDRLADQAFSLGLEAHNDDDFDAAISHYERALEFEPDHELARNTLARVLLQQNYRRGMGSEYYDDGIMALDRYFLYEANSLFNYVLKYEPENGRAEQRGEMAQEQLANQRAAVALELEELGQFAAARNEYRLALLLDPELELAVLGKQRMQREEVVAEQIRQADRLRLKGQFDEAVALLESARGDTDRQSEEIDVVLEEVAQARLELMYSTARTLESDWRYDDAVEAYDRLLAATPFFKDALARRDTLAGFVEKARELYGQFEAEQDAEARLALLRQIAVFWPEYRDVRSRLATLE